MKTYVMPGYGNRTDYLRLASWNWDRKYDLQPEIVVYGWDGGADTLDAKDEALERKLLAEPNTVAIVAVSASFHKAIQMKHKHPDKIGRIVGIAGPVHYSAMNPNVLRDDYPLLDRSLRIVPFDQLSPQELMLYYSPGDTVAPPASVLIDGVESRAVGHANHAITIGRTIFTRGKEIAHFVHGTV